MAAHSLRLLSLISALVASALAQNPPTLTNSVPGPPPDAVAVFIGQNDIASVSAAGALVLQSTASEAQSMSGVYLSHVCNSDGSWDAVISMSNYTSTGGVGTPSYYCEHGSVSATNNTWTSYLMQSMTCPLTAPFTGATMLSLTEETDSNLGALTMNPFCNSAVGTSPLVHASALSAPAPAPGPSVYSASPGTVSETGTNPASGSGSSSESGSSDSSGRRLLRALLF